MFVPRVKPLAATPLRIVRSDRAGALTNALKIMHTLTLNQQSFFTHTLLGIFIAFGVHLPGLQVHNSTRDQKIYCTT